MTRNTIRARDTRVLETSDERAAGDGVWFYLKPGYQMGGGHTIHEDTATACRKRLPEVTKCQCAECLSLLAK